MGESRCHTWRIKGTLRKRADMCPLQTVEDEDSESWQVVQILEYLEVSELETERCARTQNFVSSSF